MVLFGTGDLGLTSGKCVEFCFELAACLQPVGLVLHDQRVVRPVTDALLRALFRLSFHVRTAADRVPNHPVTVMSAADGARVASVASSTTPSMFFVIRMAHFLG
jgi:hypothetical protein